jgi:hypothetical protein
MLNSYDFSSFNEIMAGEVDVGIGSLVKLTTYAQITLTSGYVGKVNTLAVSSTVPISGYIDYANRKSLIGIVERTGEIVSCVDFAAATSIDVIRGLSIHPDYKLSNYRGSSLIQTLQNGDKIDFYALMTTPASYEYFEANEAIAIDISQDSFKTKDNAKYYDTVTSKPCEAKITMKCPHHVKVHPVVKAKLQPESLIHSDGATTPAYFEIGASIPSGKILESILLIFRPKKNRGNTITTTKGRVASSHQDGYIFFKATPSNAEKHELKSDGQLEWEINVDVNTFNFTELYHNSSVNLPPFIRNLTPDMHDWIDTAL